MGRVCNEGFFFCVCVCGSTDIKKKTTTLLHRTRGSHCLGLKYQMKGPTSRELFCLSLLQYFVKWINLCHAIHCISVLDGSAVKSRLNTHASWEKWRCHCCTSHLGAQITAFISIDKVWLIRSSVILTSQERIYNFRSWYPWQASST